MKLALFGGTFNPIHRGHIEIAKRVHEELGYDKIVFMPNNKSPLKNPSTGSSSLDRIAMINLAIGAYPYMSLSEYESRKKGDSFTIDTIQWLHLVSNFARIPYQFGLIIGEDQANVFEQWKDFKEILELSDIIIANRGEKEITFKYPYTSLKNDFINISSTEIRRDVLGRSDDLDLSVLNYICDNRLYGVTK